MTIRTLTPQPFNGSADDAAKDNLLTKQNQELQARLQEIGKTQPVASLYTLSLPSPLQVAPLPAGPAIPFGFTRFECKKDDTIVYNGILYLVTPAGSSVALKWNEEKPSEKIISWNTAQFFTNNTTANIDVNQPFTRYYKAPVDNPNCGYSIFCAGPTIGFAVLAAYYQVFR